MAPTFGKSCTSPQADMTLERLGTFVMMFTCILTPLSVFYNNPRYLYASEGFADGGDLYSHFTEANYIKEALQKGITNFWFSDATLGYPLITAYQPLPGFFVAIFMVLFERILSPLLVFRLIFVAVLSFIPAAMYKSAQIFGMKPMQQITLCLLSFAIQSWRKFGLEAAAFYDYGLLTQAFGMLILFPAVSVIYQWIIVKSCKQEHALLPVLIIALSFLTNFFIGILTCILAGLMLVVKFGISKNLTAASVFNKIQNFSRMLSTSILLISWWVLACCCGYSYVGGLPWRGESEDGYPFAFVAERFTEGEMFDSQRSFPWFTILVILGITINSLNTAPRLLRITNCTDAERIHSYWLLLSTVASLLLFLGRSTFSIFYNLIPLHAELETVKYLAAIHFCGLLHASYTLSEIIYKLCGFFHSNYKPKNKAVRDNKKISTGSKLLMKIDLTGSKIGQFLHKIHAKAVGNCEHPIKVLLVFAVSILLWVNHFQAVGKHLTMTDVNQNFVKRLKNLRNGTVDGRLLGHRGFGTASSFDLAFIPYYSGKPGIMTYSRGYHDSLSVFYLESLRFNPDKIQLFVNTLRLYNVHFLVTSAIKLDESFSRACQLKFISRIDDLIFYEVLHEDNDYGYFDFVRIAGHVRGDLKLIRQAVLRSLEFYNVNSLLLINPTEGAGFNDNVVVDVRKIALWEDWRGFAERKVQVTWSLNGVEADSEAILDEIIKADSWKWVYSQVIEERIIGNDYHAIVHVSDRGSDPSLAEHLLLKVTYHPFWKSFYYRVSDDFMLNMFNDSQLFDGKMYAEINHVIPNLMSISLPPGRYLVIFTYRFPGIFKILAVVCALAYISLLLKYLSKRRIRNDSEKGEVKSTDGESGKSRSSKKRLKSEDTNGLNDQHHKKNNATGAQNEEQDGNVPSFRERRLSRQVEPSLDLQFLTSSILQKRLKHELEDKFKEIEEDGEELDSPKDSDFREDGPKKIINAEPAPSQPVSPSTSRNEGLKDGREKESAESLNDSPSRSSGSSSGSSGSSNGSSGSSSGASGSSSTTSSNGSGTGSDCSVRTSVKDSSTIDQTTSTESSFSEKVSFDSVKKSNAVTSKKKNRSLDANANVPGNRSSNHDDVSGSKMAAILKSESSDSSDEDKSGLEVSNGMQMEDSFVAESDEDGKIVRELRQTYLRQRRNTLAGVSSLRK